jgi:hypothetical protein
MAGAKSGGTIYQWTLGWHVSACQVAKSHGHTGLLQLLLERCPPDEKLLNACWLHDAAMVDALLAQHPAPAGSLSAGGRRQLAHAARNNDTEAARLMLRAGLPVDTFSQHHATPLHWVSWHGNAPLVELILQHNPPLEDAGNDFSGTPMVWAIHGSEHGWHRHEGDYGVTVRLLLQAGAKRPETISGSAEVRAVLTSLS